MTKEWHFNPIIIPFLLALALPAQASGTCIVSRPHLIATDAEGFRECVALSKDYEFLQVLPGTYRFTEGVKIVMYLRISALGVVTFIDDTPNQSNLIEIVESTAGSTRLEGFNFVQGTGTHPNPNAVIVLTKRDGGHPIVVAGHDYQVRASGDFIVANVNRGVISGNRMTGQLGGGTCSNNASFVRHKPQDSTWETPAKWGAQDVNGDENLYIEDNRITNVFEAVDIDDDGRNVTRHNTFINSGFLHHGADTGPYGARYTDLYRNTFIWDPAVRCPPDQPAGVNSFIYLRGGTAYIHENVIPDVRSMWWGDKSEVGMTVEALGRNAGDWGCWKGGYPAPHQPGWGFTKGATLAGNLRQDLEPTYIWANTGAGNHNNPGLFDYPPDQACGKVPPVSDYIKRNREFYTGVPMPGYQFFPFPHPLTAQ